MLFRNGKLKPRGEHKEELQLELNSAATRLNVILSEYNIKDAHAIDIYKELSKISDLKDKLWQDEQETFGTGNYIYWFCLGLNKLKFKKA